MGQVHPRLVARGGIGIEDEMNALDQTTASCLKVPTRSFGPCRSTSTPIGLPLAASVSRGAFLAARSASLRAASCCLACSSSVTAR